jgi:DNA-binding PucR family transcriptional regulator
MERDLAAVELREVLRKAIHGADVDEEELKMAMGTARWQADHQFFWVRIASVSGEGGEEAAPKWEDFCDTVERLLGPPVSVTAFVEDGGIAVCVNMGLSGFTRESTASALQGFLLSARLKAGVSNSFSGIGEFGLYYKQAELALRTGNNANPSVRINFFFDMAPLLLLESCKAYFPPAMLCAPELLKLKAYDAEHNSRYFKTLSVYLKNNKSHIKTTLDLVIHRSTLIYRLERIQKITGLDIENTENQWYLLLSIKLLEDAG